ncbi:hypothetical protein E2C01_083348 [Portunus trituberculatus]|uniref:Uncharacterized protein n=1 Tax=Portunus trituberculatus TaxID=210409 RepID=A0A5B7J391_PORTR|nr:hypothetical protein [Portunus trituberculatus]
MRPITAAVRGQDRPSGVERSLPPRQSPVRVSVWRPRQHVSVWEGRPSGVCERWWYVEQAPRHPAGGGAPRLLFVWTRATR